MMISSLWSIVCSSWCVRSCVCVCWVEHIWAFISSLRTYVNKCSVSKRVGMATPGKRLLCHYGDIFHEASAMLSVCTSVLKWTVHAAVHYIQRQSSAQDHEEYVSALGPWRARLKSTLYIQTEQQKLEDGVGGNFPRLKDDIHCCWF